MTGAPSTKPARERTRSWRERKRAQGYRLVQMWVPDVNSEAFRAEARRQAAAAASSAHAVEDDAFLEAISIDPFEGD